MTETLLSELEASPERLEAQAEVSDRLHQLFTEEVARLTAGLRGSAERLEEAWLDCVRAIARGETARIHAGRDRFEATFRRHLEMLRRAERLASLAGGGDAAELSAEVARMRRLDERVFGLWKSSDDLEELAARDFPLPQSRLRELARHHKPPQSWYDEQSEPF